VHIAHAHEGANEVFRSDVLADLARRDRAVEEPAGGPRQLIKSRRMWHEHTDAPYGVAPLRVRRERHGCRHARKPRDEFPPSH
jgi:hypothetical protein